MRVEFGSWLAILVALLVTVSMVACSASEQSNSSARIAADEACAAAARLAEAPPWPPPDTLGLADAIQRSADGQLGAALQAALDHTTQHEQIAGGGFRGIAPSEVLDILEVCRARRGW